MKLTHRRMGTGAWLVSVFVLLTQAVFGAGVTDLAWISGNWVGEMGSARIEETWSSPDGGMMMGMFRLVKDDEPGFYEFMTIETADTGVVLKLRHFHPGLIGWEDKESPLTFRLVESADRKAVFEQDGAATKLIYERPVDEALTISLIKQKDGKESKTDFRYKRR
jgi:uncharacterized protein DUF6265